MELEHVAQQAGKTIRCLFTSYSKTNPARLCGNGTQFCGYGNGSASSIGDKNLRQKSPKEIADGRCGNLFGGVVCDKSKYGPCCSARG